MIEYKKLFLDEIKSFLPYLVKFFEDGSILSKEYLSDYVVGDSGQRSIIIIIYDESIFCANDNYWKVWTFNSQKVLYLKRKKKRIMILDFLLL